MSSILEEALHNTPRASFMSPSSSMSSSSTSPRRSNSSASSASDTLFHPLLARETIEGDRGTKKQVPTIISAGEIWNVDGSSGHRETCASTVNAETSEQTPRAPMQWSAARDQFCMTNRSTDHAPRWTKHDHDANQNSTAPGHDVA